MNELKERYILLSGVKSSFNQNYFMEEAKPKISYVNYKCNITVIDD